MGRAANLSLSPGYISRDAQPKSRQFDRVKKKILYSYVCVCECGDDFK